MVKVIKSEKIFEPNKFIGMWNLELDNGNNYTIASRNKELFQHKPNAVHIFGITKDNELLAIRQFRPAINDYILDLPAGLLDSNDVLAEADRELREETGYRIVKVDIISEPSYACVGMTDESSVIVFCYVEKVGEQNLQSDEDIEVVTIPLTKSVDYYNELLLQKHTFKFYAGLLMSISTVFMNKISKRKNND